MNPRFKKYRLALRALRAECPPPKPVRVRLDWSLNPLNAAGRAQTGNMNLSRDHKHVNLTIMCRYGDRRLTAEELEDVIIHEWAHAIDARPMEPVNGTAHDGVWGALFAECYRAVVGDA